MKFKQESEEGISEAVDQTQRRCTQVRESISTARHQCDKYRSVLNHLTNESNTLDEDDQHQFESIFSDFKGILSSIVEQSEDDAQMIHLQTFLVGLLDCVENYIDKKRELERVGKIEINDFMAKIEKINKSALELISAVNRDVQQIKLACDKQLSKALQFTSMMDKEENPDSTPSFFKTAYQPENLKNLINLKRMVNSPRETERSRSREFGRDKSRLEFSHRSREDDQTTKSTMSREHKRETLEMTLMIETLRNQVKVMESEIDRRDGRIF